MLVARDVVPAGFDVLVDDVWSNGSNFDQSIMLNENRIAGQIAVENGRITSRMEITENRR